MQNIRALEEYVLFFERLSLRSLPLLSKHVSVGVRFQDPFNNVVGAIEMARVLEHMFSQLQKPRFKIREQAWNRDQNVAYLKWTFSYVWPKSGTAAEFDGVSEIRFDQTGMVVDHVDYWDPTHPIYMRVPFLKWMLAKILQKLTV